MAALQALLFPSPNLHPWGRSLLLFGRESPQAVPTHFGKGGYSPLIPPRGPEDRVSGIQQESEGVGADGGFLHDHSPGPPHFPNPTGTIPRHGL